MPSKCMRSTLCFNPRTPSFNFSPSRSPISQTLSFPEKMIEQTLDIAAPMILKWDSESSTYAKVTSLFYEDKREAKKFIKCVSDLQHAMHALFPEESTSEKLVFAQRLMQVAMKRLQKEFYQTLSMNRTYLAPESVSTRSISTRSRVSDFPTDDDSPKVSTDCISEVEEVSCTVMSDLRTIAECMISSGYSKECISIYKVIRKSIIDEGIYQLGVEKLSSKAINKMDWQVVDEKIKNWLEAIKVAMNTLFSGERILCDQVFASSESIRKSCFVEISKEGAILLFSFPENIIKCKKTDEKIFRQLDMYSAIAENWPAIESIFSFESTAIVRTQALNSLCKLGESIRELLSEFKSKIQKNKSKSPVPNGGVHPLTTHALNYLSILADYNSILSDIFFDSSPPEKSTLDSNFDSTDTDESSTSMSTISSSVSIRIAWLILVLLCKLDGKAKHYKDVSLSYLFLANNVQHVVSKVRTSNLMYMLGEIWIVKHDNKVREFATSYMKLAWGRVIKSLPDDPTAVISHEEAKERFKRFSLSFEEAYRKQSSCVVPDQRLRDEIIELVARKVVLGYKKFYERYSGVVDRRVVKFAPEDIRNLSSGLFIISTTSSSDSSLMTSFCF